MALYLDIDNAALHQPLSANTTPPSTSLGNGNGTTIYRLREGIERFMITDVNNPAASARAQSSLPVMWDYVVSSPTGQGAYNHIPGGANTLYLDGHVQFNRYPDEFPATASFAQFAAMFGAS